MKAKTLQRIVAAALALVMVLLMVPVSPLEANAATTTYVLESKNLDTFAQNVKTKGETMTAGTDGYFTLHLSEKSKIDGSNKTFDDGYQSDRRISFGAKTNMNDPIIHAVQFRTEAEATVKLWWVCGDNNREVAIFNGSGAVVTKTAISPVKNTLYITELTLADAGTYYLGSEEGSNYIFKMEVTTEEVSIPVETTVATEATTEATTVATEATTVATEAPTVATEPATEPPVYDPSKIDVWDFAADQLDPSKYNNMLTVDEINSWFPSATVASTGNTTGGFTTSDGQLSFVGGGKTNHRLRVNSDYTNITCYDRGKYLVDANGVTYNGYIYSNAGGNTGVQIQIAAQAGDILTFVHCSNGTAATVNFEAPSGNVVTTEFTPADSKDAHITTFYAAETGTYKFYYSVEKLVVARIYRQHTNKVPVSGTVTAPAELTGYSLVFTCNESGAVVEAPVTDGAYSTMLNDSYSYTVSLKDANGYIITSSKELAIAAGASSASYDANVIQVDLVTVTGNITGLSEEALAAMTLAFEADTVYIPEITVTGTTYSVQLETGVTYNVVAYGINDYQLVNTTVSYTEDATADVAFEMKPVYNITIVPEGATLADLAGATFTFTNLNEEGYVYSFTGTDSIALRDGVYSVKVTNSGIFVQQLTSNLKVNGADTSKTIPFSSDVTEWDFRVDDFTGQSPYNGLVITGSFGKHGASYGMNIKNATIEVPVPGSCEIRVSVGYNWDISFADGSVAYFDDTNSGDIDAVYSYSGPAGTVTINVGGNCTSYIKKIAIVESVAFKSTLTVGASGCDFTTINDALAAVRAMPRPGNERVTIEIQPGNYEEMLVIDVPNVTLKNASSNPSLELTNKGVDIDPNAVRITSYYGHGYTYFSMGSDCKWNETILKVNKENGYASFTNPGSGTTAGSYWNATVVVTGSGFQAEGIIFENSFNQYVSKKAAADVIVAQSSAKEGATPRADLPVGSTAVQDKAYVERAAALAIGNNVSKVYFENCKFIGRQDTLYGGVGTTAAFYDCAVYGACDYIFGGMTAVFAKCDLVFNTSEDKNDKGYITAPQTASGSHGLLMYNCNVTSTVPGKDTASAYTSKPGYFGRPWAANTGEAVFYMTVIDAADTHWYEQSPSLIVADGWLNSLSGESALCGEHGTYEYAKDVDNSAKRAAWAAVFAEPTLANGEPIEVATWFGSWDPFAGKDMNIVIPTDKVDNAPEEEEDPPVVTPGASYVLDATLDLPAMAQGAKADGESETFKDYFTIMYSAKNKIDGSNKNFDDGYTASQRLNFGGKTDVSKGMLNSILFRTSNSATIKIWWVSGGDGRQFAIYDNAGSILSETTEESVKNSLYISELRVEEAGNYYLGVPQGSNYLFKLEVTEDAVAEPQEYILDTTLDLPAMAQGAKADGDSETFKDFFTIMYSAKNKIDGSNKTFDDGYTASQRLNFGGKTNVSGGMLNTVKFTTTADATVKIWWVSGGDGRQFAIYDNGGNILAETTEESVKNSLYISELSIAEAGTYYLGVPQGSNYLFKIQVVVAGGGTTTERPDWATVADPVITGAADDGEGNMVVNVSALVGNDGGDEVVVTMYDAEGNEIASRRSIAEKGEHSVSFAPTASGTYTFKAVLSRADETDKASAEFAGSFVLPLGTPFISSATSQGQDDLGGVINLVWNSVDEATGYNVYIDGSLLGSVAGTEVNIHGLTVGKTYTFNVSAIRGEEEGEKSAPVSCTSTKDVKRVWSFAAFGASTNTTANGYTGNLNEDGQVTIFSEGGKGKIVPASCDGLAFYYTAIPTKYNFTLKATVTVDSWTLSNGQEGFGLMVSDRVGEHGDGNSQFWNNSVMALASKIEYRYDSATGKYYDQSASYMGTKYSMKLGLGTIVRYGATWAGIEAAPGAIPEGFTTLSDTLDNTPAGRDAGTYNIVGNATSEVPGTIANKTTFVLEIQKNNTGYFVSYYNASNGKLIKQIKYYGADMLNALDSENVYAGFFAARNARITVKDVKLSTILASEDAPAEQRPITYIEPTLTIVSGGTSNTPEHTVSFSSNVAGTAKVSVNGVIVATDIPVVPDVRSDCQVVLEKIGASTIRVYFDPDPNQDLGEYTELKSTEQLYAYKYVTYKNRFSNLKTIYASPSGHYSNSGATKDSPIDIYLACAVAQPGQTIVLLDGTYKMYKGLRIEHGSDGTAEEPIRMIADPDGKSRPVLDFRGVGNGITHGGDYWYFQGFDVTNTVAGQKGFQIGGHYNIVDQVNTYNNGNTGLQISRFAGTDPKEDWPSNNLILNCTSYNNADPGYEDADGFAAKLTCGEGNVFDGCVAYNNADDGWDMYAKLETGNIGSVTVRNCVAYENGYVIENGKLVNAGNGNGFKMGGESLSGKHKLINCYAFNNKAKGIDSNSCPDIIVENCISYNNESHNVALYTNNAANTDFSATGIVSFKDSSIRSGLDTSENLKPKGTQDTTKYQGVTNYYWNGTNAVNTEGTQVTADWFVSLDFQGIDRNADGTINMHGFLELTDLAAENVGARPNGTASPDVDVTPNDPSVSPSTGDAVMPMLLALVMIISAAALAVVLTNRKKFF